jgi:hypothetical protein
MSSLAVGGIDQDGNPIASIQSNGTWGSWIRPNIDVQPAVRPATDLALAYTDTLNLVVLLGGKLQHAVPNSTWVPDATNIETEVGGTDPGTFTDVAAAGDSTLLLQIFGLVDGVPWHTVHNPNGTWQKGFGNANGAVGSNPGTFTTISGAAAAGVLQMVGLVGGVPLHTIRNADTSWQKRWGNVNDATGSNPGTFTSISCAMVIGSLHVVGVVGGVVWHTIRNASGGWPQKWGNVTNAVPGTNPGTATACACATGPSGSLYVLILADGVPYLTVRGADTHWQAWKNVFDSAGNPGLFTALVAAGTG